MVQSTSPMSETSNPATVRCDDRVTLDGEMPCMTLVATADPMALAECREQIPAAYIMRARLAAVRPGATILACGICHMRSSSVPISAALNPYGVR